MPILDPDELFDQAATLVAGPPSGRPTQVDLRRAVSAAYYGLFHHMLAAVADEVVGQDQRATSRYRLVYRSIDHSTLKAVCGETLKQTPSQRYAPYLPAGGFGQNVRSFAAAAIDLQEKRHRADYNPEPRFRASDADLAIETARRATRRLAKARTDRRQMFLTLLLCAPQ